MTLTNGGSFTDKVNFIWSVADLLRGTYKQSEYGRVMGIASTSSSKIKEFRIPLLPQGQWKPV